MVKKLIAALALLAAISFQVYSQELVITINGEEYAREMPEDYESAKEFIISFIDLYNEADKEIVMMRAKRDEDTVKYLEKINTLEKQLNETSKELEDAKKKAEKNKEIVEDKNDILNRAFMSFMVGPVISTENTVGSHLQFGGDFRLFKNLHIVGSIFGDLFNTTSGLKANIGVGVGLGFGIY